MKEENVNSESIISPCPCYQNLEDDIQDEFIVPDEEEGTYVHYVNIHEKCKLCGNVVNSYTDADFSATKEDYRLYLEKRVREGAVFCPYCRGLFDSKSQLSQHISALHTETNRKEGGG